MKIRALSLKDYSHAPYATWVEKGLKDIETRKWMPEDWREGMSWDILICCSKSSASDNKGKALCVVELYHIQDFLKEHEERAMCELYKRNNGKPAHAWFLRNRRLLSRKFPVTGQLSIFWTDIPNDIKLIPVPIAYSEPLTITQKKGLLF